MRAWIENRAKWVGTVGGAIVVLATIYFGIKGYVLERATAWAQEQAAAVIEETYGEQVQQAVQAAQQAQQSSDKAAGAAEHYICVNVDRLPRHTCDCLLRHRDRTESYRQYLCSQAGAAERARIEADST